MKLKRMRATRPNVPNPITGRSITQAEHGENVPISVLNTWGAFLLPVERSKKPKKKPKPQSAPEAQNLRIEEANGDE